MKFMRIFHHIYLILLSTLVGCIETKPTELQFEYKGRLPATESMSVGKKLWTTHCMGCHTNSISGLPTKIYSSSSDINGAIANQGNMRHLSFLKSNEVDYISDFLNQEVIKSIDQSKSIQPVESKLVLGTRYFVHSKLQSIYTSSVNPSANAAVNSIISFILTQPGSFGGTCVSSYDQCPGEETENYNAPMNISSNILRSGGTIKVCRELHDNYFAVNNALAYSGTSHSDDATNANISKVIDAYLPGFHDEGSEIANELKSLHAQAQTSGLDKRDAWAMVHYTLCSSVLADKL